MIAQRPRGGRDVLHGDESPLAHLGLLACHWQPVRSTEKIASAQVRSGTRSPSAEAMGIDVDRHEGLQHRPQRIGDAKPCGGPSIGRAYPLALGSQGVFLFHAPEYSRLFG
jgi:hypothetical protein